MWFLFLLRQALPVYLASACVVVCGLWGVLAVGQGGLWGAESGVRSSFDACLLVPYHDYARTCPPQFLTLYSKGFNVRQ